MTAPLIICHTNLCSYKEPAFYFLFLLLIPLFLFLIKNPNRRNSAFLLFSVLSYLLSIHIQPIANNLNLYSVANHSQSKKELLLFPYHYTFAQKIKKHLTKNDFIHFICDYPVTTAEGMVHRGLLAYYAYPVDIKVHHHQDLTSNALIIFERTNAEKFVPHNYKIIEHFSNKTLIAIKK